MSIYSDILATAGGGVDSNTTILNTTDPGLLTSLPLGVYTAIGTGIIVPIIIGIITFISKKRENELRPYAELFKELNSAYAYNTQEMRNFSEQIKEESKNLKEEMGVIREDLRDLSERAFNLKIKYNESLRYIHEADSAYGIINGEENLIFPTTIFRDYKEYVKEYGKMSDDES